MRKILVLLLCFVILFPCSLFAKKKTKATNSVTEQILQETCDVCKKPKKKEKKVKEKAPKEAKKEKVKEEPKPKKEKVKEEPKPKKEKAKEEPKPKKQEEKLKKEKKAKKEIVREEVEVVVEPEPEPVTALVEADPQTFIIKKNGRNAWVQGGIVKMQTVAENGSMLFFVERKENNWLPVIERRDLGDSTYISLFVDGSTEYRLNRATNVSYFYEVGRNFISVFYTVKNLAQVKATYTLAASNGQPVETDADYIAVSYEVANLDSNRHEFSVKSVFNTILGESRTAHFGVPSQGPVTSEYVFSPCSTVGFVTTSDGKYAVEFEVFGYEIVGPNKVAMANKDIIDESRPETYFIEKRSFTSVLSYNNSCLALFWDKVSLLQNETIAYNYRIYFSKADFMNRVRISAPEPIIIKEEPKAPPVEEPVKEEKKVEAPAPVKEEPPVESLSIDFETEREYFDPLKINAEYVQQLIDQINALERNDPSLNREKIQQLQNEINKVLEILRSRR